MAQGLDLPLPRSCPSFEERGRCQATLDYQMQRLHLEQHEGWKSILAERKDKSKDESGTLESQKEPTVSTPASPKETVKSIDILPAADPTTFTSTPSPAYSTARTSFHNTTNYVSAQSTPAPIDGGPSRPSVGSIPVDNRHSEYEHFLREKNLYRPDEEELNWSGRAPGTGQHVEFDRSERIPLQHVNPLGSSYSAEVDKVRCRRVLLARKSMTCSRKLTLEDALNEVVHLHKLRHSHIVQLVGSYIQGKTFAILLYPVAEYNLSAFMKKVTQDLASEPIEYGDFLAVLSLSRFFSCLANALRYIHDRTTKHMDIKPLNILVKVHDRYRNRHQVYITDFGVSRSFSPLDHSQTDSMVSTTPKYRAPEVYEEENKGRSADIFSMGCVFLEMYTVLCSRNIEDFVDHLTANRYSGSIYENLDRASEWADLLREATPYIIPEGPFSFGTAKEANNRHLTLIQSMLEVNPVKRPKAHELVTYLGQAECCRLAQEIFEAEVSAASVQDNDADSSLDITRKPLQPRAQHTLNRALILAAANGHDSLVKRFLDSGAELDRRATDQALERGYWSVIQVLAERGVLHPLRLSGLHLAASHGDASVVQSQLKQGADINAKDEVGRTPLHEAVAGGYEEIVRLLLDNHADIEMEIGFCGKLRTPLALAVRYNFKSVARLLLERGAKGVPGHLYQAAWNGHVGMAQLLLQFGVGSEEASLGEALERARECQRPEMVRMFEMNGARRTYRRRAM